MNLHPQSLAFLDFIDRAGAPAYHHLSVEQQREASMKLMFALRPEAPEVGLLSEAWMARSEDDGGGLRYRFYRPYGSSGAQPLAVLVYFHGGGWTVGSIEAYDVLCRQLANKSGCAVISVAYRLAPENKFPAAVVDAVFALRWVAENAPKLALDPQRIAVGGDSAGGNLATVAALIARDAGQPRVAFQLLIYPGTDQRGIAPSHQHFGEGLLLTQETIRHFQRCYLNDEAEQLDWRASPLLAPSLFGLPPTLIIAASHDPLVDDCQAYADRLKESAVSVTYSCYEGMVHGFFGLGKSFDSAGVAVDQAADALAQALS
jgi:acetyl esterase